MPLFLALLLAACATAAAACALEPSSLSTAYKAAPDTQANLPNCSCVGYRNGDVPLPKPTPFRRSFRRISTRRSCLAGGQQSATTRGSAVKS